MHEGLQRYFPRALQDGLEPNEPMTGRQKSDAKLQHDPMA